MSGSTLHRLPLVVAFAFLTVPARPAEDMKYAPDAPAPDPTLLTTRWPAHWIAPPDVSLTDYGVFLFRKKFTLSGKPMKFIVHVSADNRYRLFVNGEPVCYGPQRGDLLHWHYDSIDLAPHLRTGDNLIAIQVWNYAANRPFAINSLRSELIVQGNDPETQIANTGAGWRVHVDTAFRPIPVSGERLRTFIVVGPGDQLDAAKHPWGWEQPGFDDGLWTVPRVMGPGLPNGYGTDVERWLVPRSIPLMEETAQRLATVRRVTGASLPPEGFLAGGAPWVIPPGTTARLLLDQGFETNAFPQLLVSGGRDAKITLAYAEALFDANFTKGNRNDVDGRELHGIEDEFLPDGSAQRMFTTLDYRTYRYVELRVTTGTEPLTIDDIRSVATGYPFHENAKFASDDPTLSRIWQTGWRTARLCAGETYFDCPYYERMQYVGDTRVQALISLYVSGDDRLVRNAIMLFDQSRIPEGLTQSRYPSRSLQIINTFSLFWIAMVHDYWMHRDDPAFVAARLRGVENVLAWFQDRVDPQSGLLGPLPFWTFVDWPDQWPWNPAQDIGGEPPGAHTGGSSIVTLQYAMALDQAADIFRANGQNEKAGDYAKKSAALRAATMQACWDGQRQLLADAPDKREFSQHANALAVLSGAVTGEAARDLITRALNDRTLVQCTLYFRFYLLRALKSAGLGDQYLDQLGPWRAMLDHGLTTFAEREDPTRSDCHAWSASPVYELLATVCGVEPDSPGFKTVRIAPHLGKLNHAEAVIPHPAGAIHVKFTRNGAKLHAEVELPSGLTGILLWGQSNTPLHPGFQQLDL